MASYGNFARSRVHGDGRLWVLWIVAALQTAILVAALHPSVASGMLFAHSVSLFGRTEIPTCAAGPCAGRCHSLRMFCRQSVQSLRSTTAYLPRTRSGSTVVPSSVHRPSGWTTARNKW